MAFRLDMYTFSDIFLNHAACTRHASASSFWEVDSSVSLSWLLTESSASCNGAFGLSPGRSNVTDLSGVSDSFFMFLVKSATGSVSSFSDSSELHSVSLLIELSSVVESEVVSGSRSFSKCFIQRQVGCSFPHSSHRSGGPMSSLIRSVYVRVGLWLFCSACRFKVWASVFVARLGCGVFMVRFKVSASTLREWSG